VSRYPGCPWRKSPSATRSCLSAASDASRSRAAWAAWGTGGAAACVPRPGLAVGGDVHHCLSDGERDDLRVGHAAPDIPPSLRKEIVGGGERRREQQVEVGEHRGPFRVDGADRHRRLRPTRPRTAAGPRAINHLAPGRRSRAGPVERDRPAELGIASRRAGDVVIGRSVLGRGRFGWSDGDGQ
jgi:hypothetical protein